MWGFSGSPFLIFDILWPELFLLILLFLYIAKVAYDYMVWFFFIFDILRPELFLLILLFFGGCAFCRIYYGVAFCPSVFELSFLILVCVPSDGCPHY